MRCHNLEQSSAIRFKTPDKCAIFVEYRKARRCKESSRNKYETGSVRETDPFRVCATVGVLSFRVATVQCRTSQV